ncbi:hypothetical protein, partial [Klebsiella pneumoniae]|uniref:hypothetical protein n=1 Tax=Klebsiella pneumoniae TaxID=573 RepID=UPI0030141A7F
IHAGRLSGTLRLRPRIPVIVRESQKAGDAGVDHQTLGAGPYNPNATPPPPPHPLYANAVYYCSQDAETAFCSRSDDGGLTFGPG